MPERERPHDGTGLGEAVAPAADQGAQQVNVEVEDPGVVVGVQPGQCRLADPGRPVEVDQARHGRSLPRPIPAGSVPPAGIGLRGLGNRSAAGAY